MESFAEQKGQMSHSSDASIDAFVATTATATAVATALAVTKDPEKPSSSSNQDTGVSNLGVLDV
jgi:hypothetical protein